MTDKSKELAGSLLAGLLFGVGLVVAGMTNPSKVIGFLDVADGSWDPSLAFVMMGAIGVHATVIALLKRHGSPVFSERCDIPKRTEIDWKLLGGSALFGIGWGLGGFCPGPGVVSLVGLAPTAFVFVGAMLLGMFAVAQLEARGLVR